MPALIPDFVHPIQPLLNHPFYDNKFFPLPTRANASTSFPLDARLPEPELNIHPTEKVPALLDTDFFRAASVLNNVEEARRCIGRESANRADSHSGFTLLHYAVRAGHDQVARVLIDEGGALIDVTDKEGETALMKAAFAGHFECVKMLTSRGANVNARDRDGWSSLHNSCARGRMDIVRWLVENGANLNTFSNDGHTPLISAASKGYVEICAYLLGKGADPTLRNKNGESAYDTAAAVEAARLCELLLAAENKSRFETFQLGSKQAFDPHEHHSTVLLIVFENQRAPTPLLPFLAPQFSKDGLQKKDIRGPWSIGDRPIASLNEIHLPVFRGRRSFFWLTDWKIDYTAGCDVHGWSYARDWQDAPEAWQSNIPLHGGGGWVRQRRWVRSMKRTIDVRAVYRDNFDFGSFEENTEEEYVIRAEKLFADPNAVLSGDEGREQHKEDPSIQLARREAAVQVLLAGIQTDSNPERVRLATARAQEHLLRAELLSQQVRDNEAAIERNLTDACAEPSELHASITPSGGSLKDHAFVFGERSIRVPHSKPPNPGIVIPNLQERLPSVSLQESASSNEQFASSSTQGPLFADETGVTNNSVADPLAAMVLLVKQKNLRSAAKITMQNAPPTEEFAKPQQFASDHTVNMSNDSERRIADAEEPLSVDPLYQNLPNAEQSCLPPAETAHSSDENDATTSASRDPFVLSTSRAVPRKPAPPRSVLSPRQLGNTSSTRTTQYPIARLTRSPLVGGVNRNPVSRSITGISPEISSPPNTENFVSVSPALRAVVGSGPTSPVGARNTSDFASEYSSFPNTNHSIHTLPPTSDVINTGSVSPSVHTADYKWEDNSSVSNCHLCNCRFSFFLRKHHCRRCGKIVCDQCSLSRLPLLPSEILYPPSRGARSRIVPLLAQADRRHRVCKFCTQTTQTQESIIPNLISTRNPFTSRQGTVEHGEVDRNLGNAVGRTTSFQDLMSRFVSPSVQDPSIREGDTTILQDDLDEDESDGSVLQSADGLLEGSAMLECPVCGIHLDDLPLDSPENTDASLNDTVGQDRRERHVQICFGNMEGGKGVVGLTYAVQCLNGEDAEALSSYECGICYEEYAPGEAVARMNCLCTYHRTCIDGWFAHGEIKQCPVHHT